MSIFYDLIFLIFALGYLPVFLFRKKLHPGFGMRLGLLKNIPPADRPVWIHAVSVGEAMSIKHLTEKLREIFPRKSFVISTVTPTGNKIARDIAGKNDAVIYLPLDLSWIVRRVIARIDPALFVIAETEIWPNLISELRRKNIPIAVVNARISDRSFKRYLMVRPLVRPVLNKVSVFCVQSELDSRRLVRLGVSPEKIKLTGNMKFDIKIRDYEDLRKDYADYRIKLGLGTKEKLWVCASTHPGEEELILKAYLKITGYHPELKLLIAPRHPERSEAIEKMIGAFPGLQPVRLSRLSRQNVAPPEESGGRSVFILDTVGQLMYFYAISDVVFVGGSLVKNGGHNILEPASLGKPVMFGKYMFNFRDIAELFIKNNACITVSDRADLENKLCSLLEDKALLARLAGASRELILKNQGATAKNAAVIRELSKI